MLFRKYEFYLVITNYWPYGLPYSTEVYMDSSLLKPDKIH